MRTLRSAALTFRQLLRDRRGATAVEYGLIVALIVLAMFAALRGFAGETVKMWNKVSTDVIAVISAVS